MKSILEIKNISKKFRILHNKLPYLSIRDSIASVFKKNNETVEDFYALKDVSFEVKPGESIGIIGKNGAGKSTLLKILSKITPPSSGSIISRGRIASLLEVGTGFHPELTGRENIFLNGSILGMKRKEISAKFDEIVDFSGTEKFLDTPLKHFSSGMQLRLAFSVAAFLEPEILVIDEVLAVGDAEFQKKCMGKMEEVGKQGRTVLFVSHNMVAVKSLCQNAVLLEEGKVKTAGKVTGVIDEYLNSKRQTELEKTWNDGNAPGNNFVKFNKVIIKNHDESNPVISITSSISIEFEFEVLTDTELLSLSLVLYTIEDICVFNTASSAIPGGKGVYSGECFIPGNFLNDETYRIRILVVRDKSAALIDIDDIITFEVLETERNSGWYGKRIGVLRPELKWNLNKKVLVHKS